MRFPPMAMQVWLVSTLCSLISHTTLKYVNFLSEVWRDVVILHDKDGVGSRGTFSGTIESGGPVPMYWHKRLYSL